MKQKLFILIILLPSLAFNCSSIPAQKPKIIVKGIVYDDHGSLPGVDIKIIRTYTGVRTDIDGKFKIEVIEGDILEITYEDRIPIKIRIKEKTEHKIFLKEVPVDLD